MSSTSIKRLLFYDNTLLEYVDGEEFVRRMEDPTFAAQREIADEELAELFSGGKEPSDEQVVKVYALALGLPENILAGEIEYTVSYDLMQFLGENLGKYRIAVVAAEPRKAKRALVAYPGIVDDIFSIHDLGNRASLGYFAEDSVQVFDSEEHMHDITAKYKIAYTDIDTFREFMQNPRSDGHYDAHIQREVINGASPSLIDTIKHTRWTPGRILVEAILTLALIAVLVWWLAPETFNNILEFSTN